LLADLPEEIRVLDKRAFYLSRAKRYEESRQVLAVLRGLEPTNFLWPHMTGYQYYEEGRYAEAVPWLLEAYRLDPTHLRNLYRLAQARRHQGELLRAKFAAVEVLKLWHALPTEAKERESRTLAKASYLLGLWQVDRDPRGALALFQQAAEHDPGDHDKHYRLGKTHRRVGQTEQAVAALRRAQRIKPGRGYIEMELAEALRLAGQDEEAARHLSRAMRDARGWQAWKAARIAADLGRNEDARQMLDVAARDRTVRHASLYNELKAKLESAAPRASRGGHVVKRRHRPRRGKGAAEPAPHTGKVEHVRAAKGFGFLVDDADGERCYFKLPDSQSLSDGQPVRFRRADTKRGPAARDVRVTA
jgi:tetratricopeptide (TPR) repeat protein/cold shock CspA family protein